MNQNPTGLRVVTPENPPPSFPSGDDLKRLNYLKGLYPGYIVFLRYGDLYFFMGEESEEISIAAELKFSNENFPHCTFPFPQLDMVLHKLTKANWKVAICDLLEEPKKHLFT